MQNLKIEDVRDITIEPFAIPIRQAHEYFSGWIEHIDQPEEHLFGWPTISWPGFNEYFGGARSELVVITGETGQGKTTFSLNWLKDMLDQGRSSYLISLENGPKDSIAALGQMVLGKDRGHSEEDKAKFGEALEKWPLVLLDYEGMLHEGWVIKSLHVVCQKFKAKFIVIDHVEFIEKPLKGRAESSAIDHCLQRLQGIAKHYQATVLLIVHPAKRGAGFREKEVHIDELKGSSGIKQTAGSVIVHHRPEMDSDETWLRFVKFRDRAHARYRGGKIKYQFDHPTQTYKEVNGILEWG